MLPVTALVGAAIALLILSRVLKIGRRPKNYPPGPPTLPILGNIHQVCDKVPPNGEISANFSPLDAIPRCSSSI